MFTFQELKTMNDGSVIATVNDCLEEQIVPYVKFIETRTNRAFVEPIFSNFTLLERSMKGFIPKDVFETRYEAENDK